MKNTPRSTRFTLAIMALLVFGGASWADGSVPFKGSAEGSYEITFVSPLRLVTTGHGEGCITPLGPCTVDAQVVFMFNLDGSAHGTALVNFTDADGDTVLAYFEGDTSLNQPNVFVGTFTILLGTGRYANASGQGSFRVVEEDDLSLFLKVNGMISY